MTDAQARVGVQNCKAADACVAALDMPPAMFGGEAPWTPVLPDFSHK